MPKRRTRKRRGAKPYGWIAIGTGVMILTVTLILLFKGCGSESPPADRPQPTEFAYEAGDFSWEGDRMVYLSGESAAGVDVSYWQETVDWQQVKASGIEFAFIRVGYRSSKDGALVEDEMARVNLQGAAEAGLQVGAYFFSQALTPQEAVEEAAFAVSVVKNYRLDLPIAYDWEFVSENGRTKGMTREALMKCVHAFCQTIEAAGYETMVYYNRDIAGRLLDVEALSDYPVWFAMYGTDYPKAPAKPTYWQYTDQGSVPGIEGDVDLNLYLPG